MSESRQDLERTICEDRSEVDPEFIDFYVSRCLKSGGPVLDIGCGAGFITVALAQEQVPVVAVDNDRNAVDLCVERLEKIGAHDCEVHEADILEWDWPDYEFQTVILANNVFGQIIELEHRAQLLSDIYDHMAPGGLLLMDVPMIREDNIVKTLGQVCHLSMDENHLQQGWDTGWDPVSRTLEGAIRIEDENGIRIIGSQTHVFTVHESILSLLVGGFEVQDYWGTIDGEDLTYEHDYCYLMATRD